MTLFPSFTPLQFEYAPGTQRFDDWLEERHPAWLVIEAVRQLVEVRMSR